MANKSTLAMDEVTLPRRRHVVYRQIVSILNTRSKQRGITSYEADATCDQ